MSGDLKKLVVVLAFGAGLLSAGCDDDKSASKTEEKPVATAPAEPAKEASADLAAKVETAKEAVKDVAATAAVKVEAAAEKATEVVKEAADAAAVKVEAAKEAVKEAAVEAKTAVTAAVEAAKPAESAPAAEAAPPAAVAEAAPAAALAATPAAAAASPENAEVQAAAKEAGVEFKDSRYRNSDGHPVPVVTKDYKVDWATWQGFRRYHDACHVCHGPNALGSTFAPSLADSLKTMNYETFYGVVVGGQQRDAGGTKYIMPAFGEDKNIMCYLDDIYTYIKARSLNVEGKGGLPAGRPNGREDISAEAKKRAAECEG